MKRYRPKTLAAQVEQLQSAVTDLGVQIVAVASALRELEQKEAEPEPPKPAAKDHSPIIEPASHSKGYRAKEVAERLGIHPQTLWRWVKAGRFPRGVKIGRMTTVWTDAMIAEAIAAAAKQVAK